MPTARELALGSLRRTTAQFCRVMEDFPLDRWQDSPSGFANPLRGVLEHLVDVEGWWLINIDEPMESRPTEADLGAVNTPEALVQLFTQARAHLLKTLADRPDDFFVSTVPTCQYPDLHTGADLCIYMSQHDFWHFGQIEMLRLAFTEPDAE